ncbi:MAG: hypothetical protein K1X88_14950 [Nannocystaceae bacterium]|nr:hypothetical protein [Nannocystaceae bacterium]
MEIERGPGRRGGIVVAFATTLLACRLDSDGYGATVGASIGHEHDDVDDDLGSSDGGGASDATTSDADTRGASDDRGGAAGSDTTGGDVDDHGTSSSSGAPSDGDGGATPPVQCPPEGVTLVWAEQAELDGPMSLYETDANDAPQAAVSTVAEDGIVTFSLALPCEGQYAVWGLVWDYEPGAWSGEDPDSYYVGVGGPEVTWRYGCQTSAVASGLSWQRVSSLAAQPCESAPVLIEVYEPGTYELALRNREAGAGSSVAGIAAIAVSTDPDADPNQAYSPY